MSDGCQYPGPYLLLSVCTRSVKFIAVAVLQPQWSLISLTAPASFHCGNLDMRNGGFSLVWFFFFFLTKDSLNLIQDVALAHNHPSVFHLKELEAFDGRLLK